MNFERFTERALSVVVLARTESTALHHNYVGTEHLLMGLLRDEDGIAARVLESLDISVSAVRAQIIEVTGSESAAIESRLEGVRRDKEAAIEGQRFQEAAQLRDTQRNLLAELKELEDGPHQEVPFTPRANKVLELALREALSLGHNYIGTEHILLGLVRENEGIATRILLDFDADSDKIRNEVIRMLAGPGGRRKEKPTLAERVETLEMALNHLLDCMRSV